MSATSHAGFPAVAKVVLALLVSGPSFAQQLSGIVTDSAGTPVPGAAVRLERSGLSTVSGTDGKFTLAAGSAVLPGNLPVSLGRGGSGPAINLQGRSLEDGPRAMGISWFRSAPASRTAPGEALAKGAADFYDVLTATKAGYLKSYLDLSAAESSTLKVKLLKEGTAKFSFFVTSIEALQDLSKNPKGFGGNLQHGETGPGSGLRGADRICAAIAERAVPGSSYKGWRAFLSAASGVDAKEVNAIDRVGEGPWYDRRGRVVAQNKADLSQPRPKGADAAILNDLPNENGYPNGYPKGGGSRVDNHHTLTGSKAGGLLYKTGSKVETCQDWTSSAGSGGKPRCGVSWPRYTNDSWIAWGTEGGCAPGINLVEGAGATEGNTAVGSNGGYGGWYCLALNP